MVYLIHVEVHFRYFQSLSVKMEQYLFMNNLLDILTNVETLFTFCYGRIMRPSKGLFRLQVLYLSSSGHTEVSAAGRGSYHTLATCSVVAHSSSLKRVTITLKPKF